MANPRKFSEKIALHNQKQAEETAAFERIMQEVSVTRFMTPRAPTTHLTPHPQAYMRSFLGGSLPNVNQIASNPQMELHHPAGFDDLKHPVRHPGRFDTRVHPYTHRRMMPFDLNRHRMGHFETPHGQYSAPYLSPPPESSWRRTNSDSALHQSAMNPNAQDPFNPANAQMHQTRRDFNDNSFHNMLPYKTMIDGKKLEQHMQGLNRPKSCEAPTINVLPSGEPSGMRNDGGSMPLSGNGVSSIPVSVAHGLSHVTQIGNNTGSLPDLTNLHIPSPLSNPIDYDEAQQHPQPPAGQNSVHPLYNQARSTGNLPAASGPPGRPHLAGLGRTPASPSRRRHTTPNGPSPLSLGSPEHVRRMKYPNVTSPKLAGVKSEMKSPPLGGSYTYPTYQQTAGMHSVPHNQNVPTKTGVDPRGWSLAGSDHPGSPTHSQTMPPRPLPNQVGSMQQRLISQGMESGQPLRIDVHAASKVGQPQYQQNRSNHGSLTSPLTSPTSPTSHVAVNYSPVTSPTHEFTTGGNPSLSDYYRSEGSAISIQPLQHQFEQFHVVGENPASQHHTTAPPMYSCLAALSESDYNPNHGPANTLGNMNHSYLKRSHLPNNRIPDIVFTGADETHARTALLGSCDTGMGYGHDLSAEYFPGSEELKANLALEDLQMLEDSHIVADPNLEDQLHLEGL